MNSVKSEIQYFFNELHFEDETHSYYVKDNKLRCSVSDLVKNYYEPFDKEKISYFVAKKRGISQEEVLEDWNKKRDDSCDLGSLVHSFAEKRFSSSGVYPENGYEEAVIKFWKTIPKHIIPLFSELKMYHKTYLYAGTADLILYNTETGGFIIVDFKTNSDLFKNYKGQRLKEPFDFLLDNPFNKYKIQLSYYDILFRQTGYSVEARKVVWLKPDGAYSIYDVENLSITLKNAN